jgi:DNA-directed RNA polymerase specialized sigma24 family protein
MTESMKFVDHSINGLDDSAKWAELYPSLRSFAKHLIYSFKVSSWYGQEEDIVEDIVQEAATRILERARRAEYGDAAPIHSLEQIVWTVIRNYCIDMSRRDYRLVHTSTSEYAYGRCPNLGGQLNIVELAIEHVYEEELFTLLAREIVELPDKQRTALLLDLANLMQFDSQPTPLQSAFLALGVDLHEYQQAPPISYPERCKHSSLLSFVYKRIARTPSIKSYISPT